MKTEMSDTRIRAYQVRLRPTQAQQVMLSRLFGAKRFVWNWALQRREDAFQSDGTRLNGHALSREFTKMRVTAATAWLGELPRVTFTSVFQDFDRAWVNFFAGRAKRPRFKPFGSVDSLRFAFDPRISPVDRNAGRVLLSGLGRVRFRVTEPLEGRFLSITVRRDTAGRWIGSFIAIDVPMLETSPAKQDVIGVDVGKINTAAFSDGQQFAANPPLANERKRLHRMERKLKRQREAAIRRAGLDPAEPLPKGVILERSGRMQRTQQRIGKWQTRMADVRHDHLHQVSAKAVASGEVIVLENLNLKGVHRKLTQGHNTTSVGELIRLIEYKARWHHRQIVKVDRFFPSSRRCSVCEAINESLGMKERHWTCTTCGTHHDRDYNAAVNLEREGRRILAGETPTTRRSRGSHARGEVKGTTGKPSTVETPTSTNRETKFIKDSRPHAKRPRGRNRNGVRTDESPKKAPSARNGDA